MDMTARSLFVGVLLACCAAPATAQSDSVLYVSSGGTELFRVNSDGRLRARGEGPVLLQLRTNTNDRFVVDSAGGLLARGGLGIGTIPATGSGERSCASTSWMEPATALPSATSTKISGSSAIAGWKNA